MYPLIDTLVTPNRDTYVLLKLHNKILIRPEAYAYYFEVRGWKIEAIGSQQMLKEIA